jgi:hypothetical protein
VKILEVLPCASTNFLDKIFLHMGDDCDFTMSVINPKIFGDWCVITYGRLPYIIW